MNRSLIYRNLWFYRLVMNLLYQGHYRMRFERVFSLIRNEDRTVLELCFGDVAIADLCRSRGKTWIGSDMSDAFVSNAARKGFDARKQNVLQVETFPLCDVCIMMGSLYHFKEQLPALFRRIKGASSRFILSEPTHNLTYADGMTGYLARKLTRAWEREDTFRFNEQSLIRTLKFLGEDVGFTYRVADVSRDMILEVIWSN